MSSNNYTYLFKFIVIGDTGVGKSCLVLQFVENKIRLQHDITIGVEFGAKVVKVNQRNIKLQIWDTAGQENFRSITRSYYRSAIGALLVYDITRRETFTHLQQWLEEMKANGNPHMQILLVGNKADKQDQRQVSFEEGQEFAQQNQLVFLETSAKEAVNVKEAFLKNTQNIYDKLDNGTIPINSENLGFKIGSEYDQPVQDIEDDKNVKVINIPKDDDKKNKCCN